MSLISLIQNPDLYLGIGIAFIIVWGIYQLIKLRESKKNGNKQK